MTLYRLSRDAMRLLARIVLGDALSVRGLEAVPRGGPYLLVGNHVGVIDPALAMMWLDRTDVHCVAKSEVFRSRFQRLVLHAWHGVRVVRDTPDRTALRALLTMLADGHVVVVFPEGTRSPDGRLQRAHAGVGFLARRSGVPIVPVAITGSAAVVPRGRYIPRHAPVTLTFGEPFRIAERNPDGSRMSSQQSADAIMERIAAMLPAALRGAYGGSPPSSREPDAA